MCRVLIAGMLTLVSMQGYAVVATFQQGVDGYAGTQDTHVVSNAPTTTFAPNTLLFADGPGDVPESHILIRFDDIFGAAANQIAAGATITSATLTLSAGDVQDAGVISLYRVLGDWDEDTLTWNTASFNGNATPGLQPDGLDLVSTPTDTMTGPFVGFQTHVYDVLADLQAWSADPSANFGWALQNTSIFGYDVRSSEFATTNLRPLLSVEFETVPAPAPIALTVAVLVMLGLGRR